MSRGTEEALIQCAIAAHWGEKNIMIPNVSFARTSCRVPICISVGYVQRK